MSFCFLSLFSTRLFFLLYVDPVPHTVRLVCLWLFTCRSLPDLRDRKLPSYAGGLVLLSVYNETRYSVHRTVPPVLFHFCTLCTFCTHSVLFVLLNLLYLLYLLYLMYLRVSLGMIKLYHKPIELSIQFKLFFLFFWQLCFSFILLHFRYDWKGTPDLPL